jgi:probable F420-dependent oxidoreductase
VSGQPIELAVCTDPGGEAMSVRIGISGASVVARQGRDALFTYLDTLEAQGWDSVWFSDRIVGAGSVLDPLVGMAMVAARTQRMRFGTGVLLMSMRSPVTTARALAAIDMLSGGRLVVGVGVGQESTVEYDAMGVDKRDRGQRLDEAIHVMRRLWAEERVTHQGRFLKLKEAGVSPKPVQANVPIWIGGRTEAAFRRTGRIGDGWLPTQVTPEDVASGIRRIGEYAAEAEHHIEHDHYGIQLGCYLVESGPVPMDRVRPFLLTRRQDVGPEQLNLIGTPDQVMARIREYVDAGATKFVLGPACDPDELYQQLELQSEALVKVFHGAAV